MEFQIPISAVPNQEIITVLNEQQCRIILRTLGNNTYFSLTENIIGTVCDGVLCVDRSALVRAEYTGFVGDLTFIDTEANDDPIYTGFNTRFLLLYNTEGYPDA